MEPEDYINHLETYGLISHGMRAYLRIIVKTDYYQKHHRLSIDKVTHGHFPMISKGGIRLFATDEENLSENTLAFWFEKDFIACFSYQSTPSADNLTLEFMEDTQILSIPEKHALSTLRLFRESAKLSEAYHLEQQSRLIHQLLIRTSLSAAKGYKAILQLQPEIAKKAIVRDIASFLGIDERTLSRIRAEK